MLRYVLKYLPSEEIARDLDLFCILRTSSNLPSLNRHKAREKWGVGWQVTRITELTDSRESIVDYSQPIPSNESGCCHGTVTAPLMGSDGGRTMACLRRLSALLRVEMASHTRLTVTVGHRQTTFLGLFSTVVYNVHNLNHPPFVSFSLIIWWVPTSASSLDCTRIICVRLPEHQH